MNIYHNIQQIPTSQSRRTLLIGHYDGLHLGHQHMLQQAKQLDTSAQLMVLTFDTPPSNYFTPDHPKLLIQPLTDRLSLFQELGVHETCVQTFDQPFSSITAPQLVDLLVEWNVSTLIMGFDQALGAQRAGDLDTMTTLCAPHHIQVTQLTQIGNISSSAIRQALKTADLHTAQQHLGRPFSLTGTIIHGQQIGRTIGFPTANLQMPPLQLLPKFGVYRCHCHIQAKHHLSVVNIGIRPTLDTHEPTVEVHILDYQGNLYGETLHIHFEQYIREERKFDTLHQLQQQIAQDIQTAKQ